VTDALARWWRPLAFGLAAVSACALPAAGQGGDLAEKIQFCSACHGDDGNSKIEKMPSLAGQPAFFILNQLFLMREGVRKIEAMAPIVKDLKDEDLDGLSKHFSSLPAKRSDEPVDAALVKRGAEIARRFTFNRQLLSRRDFSAELAGNFLRDLALNGKQIVEIAIVLLHPDMSVSARVD